MRRVEQSKEEEILFPGATPLTDRTRLMVGPEAAASAGASGSASRCPWSWGRCWLRGRRWVWGPERSKRGDSPLCRRGGCTSRKALGGGECTGVGLVWASSGLGRLPEASGRRPRKERSRLSGGRLRSCFPPGAFGKGYSEVVLTGKHLWMLWDWRRTGRDQSSQTEGSQLPCYTAWKGQLRCCCCC